MSLTLNPAVIPRRSAKAMVSNDRRLRIFRDAGPGLEAIFKYLNRDFVIVVYCIHCKTKIEATQYLHNRVYLQWHMDLQTGRWLL